MNQKPDTTFHDTSQSLDTKQICVGDLFALPGAQYTFDAFDPPPQRKKMSEENHNNMKKKGETKANCILQMYPVRKL